MAELENGRIAALKKSIGFEEAVRGEAPNRGVVLEWPEPLTWPELADPAWGVAGQGIYPSVGSALRNWTLRQGQRILRVDVFVSSLGPELAHQFLLGVPAGSSMADLPYKRGPRDLGTLSIQHVSPRVPSLVWCYHNVCVRLSRMGDTADVLPLARHLQELMADHVLDDFMQHAPAIDGLEASAERLSVGELLAVRLKLGAGVDPQAVRYGSAWP